MKAQITPIISDLMTLSEVAKYLGKSRPHIYKLMSKSGLPSQRIASRWTFRRSLVDAWLSALPGVNLPQAG